MSRANAERSKLAPTIAPRIARKLAACLSLSLLLGACGVRGRPQPPLQPADLGRGQPTFKRATEEFRFENVPNPDATPEPTPASKPKVDSSPKKAGNTQNNNQRNSKPSGDSN